MSREGGVVKTNRQAVYEKYGGHCAYCWTGTKGTKIAFKDMEIDHYWPAHLSHLKPEDPDRFDNLLPTCKKCNRAKMGYRPEEWRTELSKQVQRLRKNAQFDRALRFGQIEITESPIVFYFEKRRG